MKAMIEQHRNSLFENSCAIVTRSLSSRGVWELTCHYQFFKIQLKIPGGVHNHTRPLLNWAGRRGRRAQTQMCNAVCSTLASPLFAPGVRRRAARNSVSLLLLLGCLASAHRAFTVLEMLWRQYGVPGLPKPKFFFGASSRHVTNKKTWLPVFPALPAVRCTLRACTTRCACT